MITWISIIYIISAAFVYARALCESIEYGTVRVSDLVEPFFMALIPVINTIICLSSIYEWALSRGRFIIIWQRKA